MEQNEIKPFMPVLVRKNNSQPWCPRFFFCEAGEYGYADVMGETWKECIPYYGNESLLYKGVPHEAE